MLDVISYLEKNFKIEFNSQQRKAVLSSNGRYLLIAVPGAGKTTVMTARIANLLLNCGVKSENILTITFNKESANDMKRRFKQLFSDVCDIPSFSTIHSVCFSVLKRYSKLYGRKMPELISDSNGSKMALLRRACRENGVLPQEDELEELAAAIGFVKNRMYTTDEIAKHDCPVQPLDVIYKSYETIKRENSLMDFDDMLLFTLTILKKIPSLLNFIRKKYRYINVDEAQDTSVVQHEIIRLIVSDDLNLFMVGDEDQSIYGFRGAYPEELLKFKEIYKDAEILKMEENFRSTPQIVEYAKEKISENAGRYEKSMFTNRNSGKRVRETVLYDANEYIAKKLKKLPASKTAAVIYRTNDCAVALIDALKKNGIDFYIREHRNRFLNSAVTADILAFIRLAKKPDDIEAFKRVCFKNDAKVSRDMLDFVCAAATPGENLYDVLMSSEELDGVSCDLIEGIKNATGTFFKIKPLDVIKEIEYAFGYRNFLRWKYKGGYYFEIMLQKLTALKSLAANCNDTESFIDRVYALSGEISGLSSPDAMVTLSTVHSSKGLEFDYVFMIDLIEGFFPSAYSIEKHIDGDDSLLEEERRLFYVGITRARDELELITASRINGEFYSTSRFAAKKETQEKKKVFGGGIGIGKKQPSKRLINVKK